MDARLLFGCSGFSSNSTIRPDSSVSVSYTHLDVYKRQADTCHKYDKCWSCPPGCGSLEECEAKVRQYKYGIIVQTVGELEDVFDGEGMMETEARHKEYFCLLYTSRCV